MVSFHAERVEVQPRNLFIEDLRQRLHVGYLSCRVRSSIWPSTRVVNDALITNKPHLPTPMRPSAVAGSKGPSGRLVG